MVDAIVLCGGYGTRLQGVLPPGYPKALVDVNGKPFLAILLDHLIASGFKRVVLCTGYGAGYIHGYVVGRYTWRSDVRVLISHEGNQPIGTWGAIVKAIDLIQSDPFLVLNGDTICTLNYSAVVDRQQETQFQSIRVVDTDNTPVGVFVVNKQLLRPHLVPAGRVNLEDVVAADLLPAGLVLDYTTGRTWYDIGTPAGLARFKAAGTK